MKAIQEEGLTCSLMPEHKSAAAKAVAQNTNLLIEILKRLPPKSLLRFKSVSQHWLSLITSPSLCMRRRLLYSHQLRSSISGLFLQDSSSETKIIDFISLNNDQNQIPTESILASFISGTGTSFPGLPTTAVILSSCNGLICCYARNEDKLEYDYLVYNPTTGQLVMLPPPDVDDKTVKGELYLAFDPSKSPHYKVICLWTFSYDSQILIYSSETGKWKLSGSPFDAKAAENGFYWNAAINWIDIYSDGLFFNVKEERVGTIPMISVRDDQYDPEIPYRYFGESGGHLHLLEMIELSSQFVIYELKTDYSEWFVKYSVDLDGMVIAFPEMDRILIANADFEEYAFHVLAVVHGAKDEDSFLALRIPGKIIRYNFVDKSFNKLCDFDDTNNNSSIYDWEVCDVFQYIECFCSIRVS